MPRSFVAALSVCVFAVFCIYAVALPGPFIFDDHPNIRLNEAVHVKHLSFDALYQAWSSGVSSVLGRPVAMLSFGLNYWVSGLSPFSFRLVNLAIHALNAVLVLFLVYQLLFALGRNGRVQCESSQFVWLAGVVSLAWALHPINATPVLYIVQRMTSLSAFFGLLALNAYLFLRIRSLWLTPLSLRRRWLTGFFIFGVALPLSVLSKESGALVLLWLALVEWLVFGFGSRSGERDRALLWVWGVVIALPLLAGVVSLAWVPDFWLGGYSTRQFGLGERLLTEARAIWLYLGMIVMPNPEMFSLYHDEFSISTGWWSPPSTLFAVVGVFALPLLAWWAWRAGWVFLAFGIAWFLVGHLLESTIFPLELVFEHRNYLASLGPLLAIFLGLLCTPWRTGLGRVIRIGLLVMLGLFAVNSALRAYAWRSYESVALMMAANNPNSMRSNYESGRMLAELYHRVPDAPPYVRLKAREHLSRAAELDRKGVLALSGLILLQWYSNEPIDAGLFHEMERRLAVNRPEATVPDILFSFVSCRTKGQDCPISDGQIQRLFDAVLSNPSVPASMRGNVYNVMSLDALGHLPDKAIDALRYSKLALDANPAEIRLWVNRIRVLIRFGFFDEAQRLLILVRKHDSAAGFGLMFDELEGQLMEYRRASGQGDSGQGDGSH